MKALGSSVFRLLPPVYALLVSFSCSQSAFAEALPEADKLLSLWKNAIYSEHEVSQIELRLEPKDGAEIIRKAKIWYLSNSKEAGPESSIKMLMKFNSPKEMRGVTFLSIKESASTGADQWLYFPVYKKARRLSSHSRDESFLDSEFTTGDISFEYEKCFDFKTKATAVLDGDPVYVIEGLPRPKIDVKCPYSLEKLFVRKKDDLVVKVEFYDTSSNLLKTLSIKDWKKQANRWTADSISVENVQTKNRSTLRFLSREVTEVPAARMFTMTELESGK